MAYFHVDFVICTEKFQTVSDCQTIRLAGFVSVPSTSRTLEPSSTASSVDSGDVIPSEVRDPSTENGDANDLDCDTFEVVLREIRGRSGGRWDGSSPRPSTSDPLSLFGAVVDAPFREK